jgi:hypothetical protein
MTYFTTFGKHAAYLLALVAILVITGGDTFAQTPPNLGTAASYGAFSGAGAIGNTGLTVVHGDIGTYVGSFTGFPPGQYTGAKHVADAAALAAKNDLILAYNSMNDAAHAIIFDTALNATMGNGQVLTPRTYGRSDLTTISGTLTFDAKGNTNGVFIIKIRAALNVSANTHIVLINGAQAANIYWAVDGAVSILDNSTFKGTIVANGAIHLYGGSTLEGRALAVVGAITLASNYVSGPGGVVPANTLVVITPAPGDTIRGGTPGYRITWGGTGIASHKTFELSLDSGLTWTTIGSITADTFMYAWNVPDTSSKKAFVRITDANNLRGVSGLFTIASSRPPASIIVVHPALGELITGGTQNFQITWTGASIAPQKTFELSLDSGLTWKPIGTITADTFAYGWNVPDTVSTRALIRITDKNGVTGKSGLFTIRSSKLVVVRPALGEIITGGTKNYQITWTGSSLTAQKTFEYSLDGGQTWKPIGTITADVFAFSWNVPDTSSTTALVRITDKNGVTGTSGLFTIKSTVVPVSSIVVTRPAAGEIIAGGSTNYLITFTAVNTTQQKMFEYSLDGGAIWNFIGIQTSDAQTFNWPNVPNVATTQALIRITDANLVTGVSGLFTIKVTPGIGSIDGITLDGLDSKGNIDNNKTLGISWTYTPDIGTTVEIEYSLDYTATWNHIATQLVSDLATTPWLTPMTGYYNPVFIRVTSSKGMTRTSSPFSIGTKSAVSANAPTAGYSVSNYPNPANDQATISFTLPVQNDVTVTVTDGLGREVSRVVSKHFNAGTSSIALNTSKLAAGMYSYSVQAGTTRLSGRMSIVR